MLKHRITVVCLNCGVEFPTFPCRLRRGGGRFCSTTCYRHSRTQRWASLEDRFWAKVHKPDDPDGCWLWTAALSDGYGRFGIRGRTLKANRLAWEFINGPVPEGMKVLHNCPGGDNRACVNPAHLWLGTLGDNNRDTRAKGRVGRTPEGRFVAI